MAQAKSFVFVAWIRFTRDVYTDDSMLFSGKLNFIHLKQFNLQSGVHIYNLLIHYSMHWNVKLIALCQFIVVVYFYGRFNVFGFDGFLGLGVENLLADIRVMLRLPSEECVGSVMRFIGPTGHFVRHTWNWICPLFILFALVLDIFTKNVSQSKRVGDSQWWHVVSIVSALPILSFVCYVYTKVCVKCFWFFIYSFSGQGCV